MKKILLFVAAAMVAMSASAVDLYLRGTTPGWGAQSGDTYKFTEVSAGVYELENINIKGEFKVATITAGGGWDDTYNYGPTSKTTVSLDQDYTVTCGAGAQNFNSNDNLAISKITLDVNTMTLRIIGTATANVFDMTKDYGVMLRQYEESSDVLLTFEGNGVYTAKNVPVTGTMFKIADEGYSEINYGGLEDNAVLSGVSYSLDKGSNTNLSFSTIAIGSTINVTVTFASDWSASVLITVVSEGEGGDQGGDQGGEEGGEEGGDDPIVTPTGADYYLIGWINNADYGDKEDWENLGDYKFVDGSLVATFEVASYVAIKTGDLSKWYFAEAYTEESSVTLEAGKDFGEKLYVPGGVEVTFTLVENGDGSLTLSYTTGTTTDLEDIDAEDAVVAAYDLIGRPVAADAAGYVILQYASGKAAKVFNY